MSRRAKPDFAQTASPIDYWMKQEPVCGNSPARGYVICSTPRTGSYFLCDLLRSTGCLGRPHEYFGGPGMRRLGLPDYPLDLDGQIAATLSCGRTANGVFGAKLFAAQFERHGKSLFKRLNSPVLVFLEREDLLGQAISLTRAAQEKAYFASTEGVITPRFDAALIRDYLDLIIGWNAKWQLYFTRCGLTPLRMSYERVMASPQVEIDRIAAALRLDEPARIKFSKLSLAIQRDDVSADWRKQFIAAQPAEFGFGALRGKIGITVQRRARRIARLLRLRQN